MVDTIILAMFAMMITAFSYGRMASICPSAGSAYTYVAFAINPHVGTNRFRASGGTSQLWRVSSFYESKPGGLQAILYRRHTRET